MWISEAAEAAGVNVETLRYYERRGLLPRPRRPVQGYREYSEETVRLVRFIKHAQDLGFSLEEIQELARLSRSAERDRERARAVAERKIADIDRKLSQLQAIRRGLEQLVSACLEGSTPECPILEAIGPLDAEPAAPAVPVPAMPNIPSAAARPRRGGQGRTSARSGRPRRQMQTTRADER